MSRALNARAATALDTRTPALEAESGKIARTHVAVQSAETIEWFAHSPLSREKRH
ncbi:hypothetical protein [Paeniglutamicibacter cryotolerans]|uniref:Uncharacterized protein n=1 Tax=Paeniglutamicibacter cryotolerans TaxID=670079 RepID=A0A839QL72_9MICC|nr:hypothetical protein [Paeniglutamicibacter cryotolerans]MBB2997168.1 hypothetical protein [Paeniglutamicibacter cryotolerans]